VEYKRIFRNVIYFAIVGIVLLIIQFISIPIGIKYGLIDGSYPQARLGAEIMIFWSWFGVIETSVFFLIIPIKYLTMKRKSQDIKKPKKTLICSSCGTEILDGEFCSKCGSPIK